MASRTSPARSGLDRRGFLTACAAAGITGTLFPSALLAAVEAPPTAPTSAGAQATGVIDEGTIAAAEKIACLTFTPTQRTALVKDLNEQLGQLRPLRALPLANGVAPAIALDLCAGEIQVPSGRNDGLAHWQIPTDVARLARDDDLAFLPLAKLASLLKKQQVTATELTELCLDRLKRFDPQLKAVITLTEERARKQAAQADAELRAGNWRGPLHGVPWGAKDLLAVAGYPTTWGALPFKDQHFDEDAEVVRRLDAAGAILVAKLSLGALALGDNWFGGTTKCPWNLSTGSSGSSAGPAAAVSAGLVPFAIGSETRGSIVSPCTKCGVTGLRPTFGRVSRRGAMALAWSMDKLGPIARTAEDCALIFSAVHGKDPEDFASFDAPFSWPAPKEQEIRVGYLAEAFEGTYEFRATNQASLATLRGLGFTLTPIKFPTFPIKSLDIILGVEAATAFDELTRSGEIDHLLGWGPSNWGDTLREARFTSAVDYLQANRARTILTRELEHALSEVDVVVAPSFRGDILAITNLTGHPAVVVPDGFTPLEKEPDSPRRQASSLTFLGRPYRDDLCLAVAHAFQEATPFHTQRPPLI